MAMGIKEIYSLILYYAFAWLAVSISVSESNVQLVVYFRSFFSSLLPLRFSVFCWGTLSMHRKFDRLFVYLLSFSILAPISLCCLRFYLGVRGDSERKQQPAIYLLVYDSVSCIRNIEPKLLWSLCSMRHILKRQNLRCALLSHLINTI